MNKWNKYKTVCLFNNIIIIIMYDNSEEATATFVFVFVCLQLLCQRLQARMSGNAEFRDKNVQDIRIVRFVYFF